MTVRSGRCVTGREIPGRADTICGYFAGDTPLGFLAALASVGGQAIGEESGCEVEGERCRQEACRRQAAGAQDRVGG